MREIKFRAWHGKVMRYYYLRGFLEAGKCLVFHENFHDELVDDYFYLPENKFNGEIMQFTGLRDKNGLEIYEGDVVECDYREISTGKRFPLRGCVEWDNASCCYICKSDNGKEDFVLGVILGDPRDPVEIFTAIGNIHENADLLKERTEGE